MSTYLVVEGLYLSSGRLFSPFDSFTPGSLKRLLMTDGRHDREWASLLERVRGREDAAQRALVSRLWPFVAGTVVKLCPRRDSVEDLAQETFSRIFSRLHQFRGGHFPAWVARIARHVAYDALRKQRVRPEWTFTELGYDPDIQTESTVQPVCRPSEARELLARLFQRLPGEMVWLLNEIELKERKIGDVAKEMGWTATAARLRLMRARRKLKDTYLKMEGSR